MNRIKSVVIFRGKYPFVNVTYYSNTVRSFSADTLPETVRRFVITAHKTEGEKADYYTTKAPVVVFKIQGNFCGTFETLYTCDTAEEAEADLKAYRENDTAHAYRIKRTLKWDFEEV